VLRPREEEEKKNGKSYSTFTSERRTGHRNRVYHSRSEGQDHSILEQEVRGELDKYFKQLKVVKS
jgi:hypothetical protein